jgi:hypothetical protein
MSDDREGSTSLGTRRLKRSSTAGESPARAKGEAGQGREKTNCPLVCSPHEGSGSGSDSEIEEVDVPDGTKATRKAASSSSSSSSTTRRASSSAPLSDADSGWFHPPTAGGASRNKIRPTAAPGSNKIRPTAAPGDSSKIRTPTDAPPGGGGGNKIRPSAPPGGGKKIQPTAAEAPGGGSAHSSSGSDILSYSEDSNSGDDSAFASSASSAESSGDEGDEESTGLGPSSSVVFAVHSMHLGRRVCVLCVCVCVCGWVGGGATRGYLLITRFAARSSPCPHHTPPPRTLPPYPCCPC